MKVSAIIVTYNRLNILKICLKSLLSQNYNLNTIIIINNNSTDGTREYLDNLHNKKFIVKNMNQNVGGSGGFSEGIKLAYEYTNSDYFWVMDDDSSPKINALDKLVTSAKKLHNNFGFLCSNVRSLDDVPINVPIVSKYWTESLPSNLVRVKASSFVSLFVSRNIVSKVGLPIRQMFIWGDDFEYTLRISNKYRCKGFLVSDSIVTHESVASNKGSNDAETIFNSNRIKLFECSYRNYMYISRKYYGAKGITKRILSDVKCLFEIPFLSKNKRIIRLLYVLLGIFKGFFFNPKIEYPKENYNNKFLN